ncbi:MAG: nitroreductase family protein, partial [Chryseobacterium sp.]
NMNLQIQNWNAFKEINRRRRAIKDFEDFYIPDQDVLDILEEAILAPSSANSQPYQIHWIKTPELKSQVAKACNGQRAAAQANGLLVFVTSTDILKNTIKRYAAHIQQSKVLTEKSKAFHGNNFRLLGNFLKIAPLVIWTPILGFFSWFLPALSILPFGAMGIKHWTAKNSIFAAQNLLLATVAKGYDACPMEGFNAQKIASLLDLPYGSVIPIVIAFGKRRSDANVEPQWRRSIDDVVKIY